MAAQTCHAAAAHSSTVHGHIFADDVVIADLQPRLFAFVFQVLGFEADGGKWEDAVVRADLAGAVHDDMGDEFAILSQLHIGSDYAERANVARGRDLRAAINDCTGMNLRSSLFSYCAG